MKCFYFFAQVTVAYRHEIDVNDYVGEKFFSEIFGSKFTHNRSRISFFKIYGILKYDNF